MSATATDLRALVRARRQARPPAAVLGVLLAAAVVVVVNWPVIFGGAFEFVGFDWFQHQWYLWHMEDALSAHGLPVLFSHNTSGVFDPHYAFYGGTLYALVGYLTLLVGSHTAGYALSWVLAAVLAYGAWFWLARQAGLGPWWSHAPAVLFVTSPWYVAELYTWGSWAQAWCFGALVLMLAAAVSILRADRLRAAPAAALAFGVIVYTGSHNLTLAWGTTVTAVVLVALVVVVPAARRLLSWAGAGRILLVGVPALMVNGWYLLPAIVYQSETTIARQVVIAHGLLTTSMDTVGHAYTLSLGRPHVPVWTHLGTQFPFLFGIWALAALIAFRPPWRSPWVSTAVVLSAAGIGMALLLTRLSWILALPHPLDMVQGPYRLEAYLELAAAGLVIAILVLAGRTTAGRRRWAWVLVPLLVVSIVQANAQVHESIGVGAAQPPWSDKAPFHTVASPLGAADYINGGLPILGSVPAQALITFSPSDAERDSRVVAVARANPGDWVITNLKAATWLVKVQGASVIGRDGLGNAVMQVDRGAPPGAARIVVSSIHPWPVVVGRDLTILGLAGLLAIALGLLRRRLTAA